MTLTPVAAVARTAGRRRHDLLDAAVPRHRLDMRFISLTRR